jgi:hypothetical protein
MGFILAMQARQAELVARRNEQEAQRQREEAEQSKDAWLKLSAAHMEVAIDANILSQSARLDADLLEYKTDARMGLLKLARPLTDSFTIPAIGPNFSGTNTIFLKGPDFVKLREFQTAAVISAGQEFVPLVPPLASQVNPQNVDWRTSPNGRLCIVSGDRGSAVLFAIPGLARLSNLCENNERVLQSGFSPDSQTIWTQDVDSVVRFWNPDGTFRARTPMCPDRVVYPAGMTFEEVRKVAYEENHVILADGVTLLRIETGQYDLYSTRTGQFIRRLEQPGQKPTDKNLSSDNRWLVYPENRQIVIISADDGQELARLDLGVSETSPSGSRHFDVSPNRQWVMAWSGSGDVIDLRSFRLWRSHDWQLVQDSALTHAFAARNEWKSVCFYTDDLLGLYRTSMDEVPMVWVRIGQRGFSISYEELQELAPGWYYPKIELGGKLFREERTLYTADPFQRLNPPRGRTYHPDLVRIAADERFFENLDTVTEKELPHAVTGAHIAGIGLVEVKKFKVWNSERDRYCAYQDAELRYQPDPSKLGIPGAILELWAQLVVGGELGSDGVFQAWDQPTWAAKQKELSAMKPPYGDFPFPGWAATEPNLWYLIQANMASNDAEREQLLGEWRRRTGRIQYQLEPDTWRTPEVAPLTSESNSP